MSHPKIDNIFADSMNDEAPTSKMIITQGGVCPDCGTVWDELDCDVRICLNCKYRKDERLVNESKNYTR